MRITLPSTARLSGLRLSHVLGASFGLVLALLVGILAYSLWSQDHVATRLRATAQAQAARLELLRSMRDQANLVYSSLTSTVIAGPDDLDYEIGQLTQARDRHEALMHQFRDGLPAAGPQRAAADKALSLIDSSSRQVYSMADSLVGRVRQDEQGNNRRALGSIITNTVAGHSGHWLQGLQTLTDLQVALGRQASEDAEADVLKARRQTIAIAALAVVVGLGTAVLISRVLTRSLGNAVKFAERVACGELDVTAPPVRGAEARQLFQALEHMQGSLRHLVQDIRVCAEAIETASDEVASGNLDLSRRTEETSSRLQETSALMRRITDNVRDNTASASSAHELASQACDQAQQGGSVVHQAIRDMDDIASSSQRISDIIGVINRFASQTNILALNAAVEAARAGESGRGFSVVAAEVRTLAQRVTQSAMEIRDLIDASARRVEVGTARVNEAGATMGQIVDAVRRVGAINAEISSASHAQGEAIASVDQAVTTVDNMTQQNAALVEQSAAAADSLRAQARRLISLVTVFRIDGAGGAARREDTAQASAAVPATLA